MGVAVAPAAVEPVAAQAAAEFAVVTPTAAMLAVAPAAAVVVVAPAAAVLAFVEVSNPATALLISHSPPSGPRISYSHHL